MLYAFCFAPEVCVYTSRVPSLLQSGRPRPADECTPSYFVTCRGAAPAFASTTYTFQVLYRSASFPSLPKNEIRCPSGDHDGDAASMVSAVSASAFFAARPKR